MTATLERAITEEVAAPPAASRRPAARVLAGAGVLAALVAAWAVMVHGHFFYSADDVYEFAVARQSGLGWRLLGLNVFSHFGPINEFIHWMILTVSPFDATLGFTLIVVFYAGMLLGLLWVLTELGVPFWARIAAVVYLGIVPPAIADGTWSDQAFHSLIAVDATLVVVAAHVRGVRLGRWRWHVLSIVALGVGLLTQERAALVMAIVVLLDVLVLWRDLSLVQALRRLWEVRAPLAVMLGLGVPATLVIEHYYSLTTQRPGVGTIVGLVHHGLADYFLPTLVGMYRGGRFPMWANTAVVPLVLIAVTVVLGAVDRRNLKPILFFGCVFSLFYGLLYFSPLIVNGVDASAVRVDYMLYPLPFAMVAVTALRIPLPAWARRPPARRAGAVAAAAAGIVLVVTLAFADQRVLRNWMGGGPEIQAYEGRLAAQRPLWSSPDTTFLPLRVRPDIAGGWTATLGEEEDFLTMYDPGFQPSTVHGPPVILDAAGDVVPVGLRVESLHDAGTPWSPGDIASNAAAASVGAGCLTFGDSGDFLQVRLPGFVAGAAPQFVDLGYTADRASTFRVTSVGPPGTYAINDWPSSLDAGTHRAVFRVGATGFGAVQLQGLAPGTHVCIDSVAVVRPAVRLAGSSQCAYVDEYGAPAGPVACDALRSDLP